MTGVTWLVFGALVAWFLACLDWPAAGRLLSYRRQRREAGPRPGCRIPPWLEDGRWVVGCVDCSRNPIWPGPGCTACIGYGTVPARRLTLPPATPFHFQWRVPEGVEQVSISVGSGGAGGSITPRDADGNRIGGRVIWLPR